MNLIEKIQGLTEDEAENCLNCLLKNYAEQSKEFREIVGSPDDPSTLKPLVSQVVGEAYSERLNSTSPNDPEAVQALLMAMAQDPELSERLEGCIEQRKKLIEPITTALVMAGLILVLKSRIKFKYEIKDGKKHFMISYDKQPSDEKTIRKVLGVF